MKNLAWLKGKASVRSLPLGLDISPGIVAAVATVMTGDEFVVRASAFERFDPEAKNDVSDIVKRVVERLDSRERRCILSISEPDAFTVPVNFVPSMRRTAIINAAYVEAHRFDEDFPERDRVLSLAHAHGNSWVLGVARKSAVRERTALAKHAGLRVRAIDDGACAWRRAIGEEFDAVLDFGADRTRLVMFGEPIGESKTFFAKDIVSDSDFIEAMRNTLNVARLEDVADVRRLAVAGMIDGREPLLDRISEECGVAISLAAPIGLPSTGTPPPWLLAFGLALWSVEGAEQRAS
jgi:hypothetical protein